MIAECPHSHTNVLPAADGTCPSCEKDTNDASDADPDVTSVHIWCNRNPMPDVCLNCGTPTTRRKTVTRKCRKPEGGPTDREVLRYFFLLLCRCANPFSFYLHFFKPVAGPKDEDPGYSRKLRVRLPQRRSCAWEYRLEPEHVDFHRGQMTFLAHREFKEHYLEGTNQ